MGFSEFVKNHAGTICSVLALGGLGASVYFSGKAAVEAQDIDEDLEGKEKFKAYAKVYSKTAVSVAVTAGLIIASDRAHAGNETALAGAAALWASQYKNLKEAVDENVDEETVEKVHRATAEKGAKREFKERGFTGDPSVITVYEPVTDQYFETTSSALYFGLLKTNAEYASSGDVSLDFWLRKVGGKTGLMSAEGVGWNIENTIQDYNWSFCANAPYIDYVFDNETDDKGRTVALIVRFNLDPIKQCDEDMSWYKA